MKDPVEPGEINTNTILDFKLGLILEKFCAAFALPYLFYSVKLYEQIVDICKRKNQRRFENFAPRSRTVKLSIYNDTVRFDTKGIKDS